MLMYSFKMLEAQKILNSDHNIVDKKNEKNYKKIIMNIRQIMYLLEHYNCLFSTWHISNRPIYEFTSLSSSRSCKNPC